ncbi:MAG: hypothetical protein H7A25_10700 [Leptospiraceae bacterium]|nr:hypothetical protein [Leptospiraceae bacterium]MCP5500363.1 hypothetical protein [Leptospiraceae bacterium]
MKKKTMNEMLVEKIKSYTSHCIFSENSGGFFNRRRATGGSLASLKQKVPLEKVN